LDKGQLVSFEESPGATGGEVRARVIAVVGATGTGKSALADALAVHLGGEIVGVDSMQVYRGMDIGTAKTPATERSVPYHCIDLVDPGDPFTAALYQRHARAAIDDLLACGKTPVLCGGTGLYLRATLDDFALDEGCEDTAVRKRFEAQAEELGAEAFHAVLGERDPKSAALIHPNNVRRVVRAFEFLEQGTSYAEQTEGFSRFEAVYPTRFVGITVERDVLYEVIERRVDAMMAAGLLDEVRGLLAAGFHDGVTAQQAIGYKELVGVLEGARTLEDAVAEIKQSSRRYAKRQGTWFKRDMRIAWIDATDAHRAVLAGELDASGFTQRLLESALQLVK
jgi:tRNA dimethylallyltransferase